MISIRCVQHRCTVRSFVYDRPKGINEYVLILAHTPAYFHTGETKYCLRQNQLFIYNKWQSQLFYNAENSFCHDWFHFNMDEGDLRFFLSLHIPFGQPVDLSSVLALSDLIRHISVEHATSAPHSGDVIHNLVMCFFMKVSDMLTAPPPEKIDHPLFHRINALREEIYIFPYREWTVDKLAEAAHVSRSWFQHKYREWFDATFQEDLIDSRVEYSKRLLTQSDHTVDVIAEQCGYGNSVHFMRQFKKKTGLTPSAFRKLF